jgi:endonuclease-8
MPEGPSIVILKEEVQKFKNKKIESVEGNSKLDIKRMEGKRVKDFKSWGKHFLICFDDFTLRIHLMLFGSYRIDERKEASPRVSLKFKNGELNFYSCSVKFIEGDLSDVYDWEVDVMADEWNEKKVLKLFRALGDTPVCDALLDQNVFAGSGNIVKNEVLFRVRLHPLSKINALSARKQREVVKDVRAYCQLFYEWKKKYEFKKHWQVYKKGTCPRDNVKLNIKPLGKNDRRTYYCTQCQILYAKEE